MNEEPRVKICAFELENVKRVRAVDLMPKLYGLTVIGGNNAQGKTSILDAIAYALGGERMRPTAMKNDEGQSDPKIRIELSNGILVERKGKNSSLTVTDKTGQKQGQKLLDAFVGEFALNLPRFLNLREEEKALEILRNAGIDEQLEKLDEAEKTAMDKRRAAGQVAERKEHAAAEMPEFPEAPEAEQSAGELMEEVAALQARNQTRAEVRNAIERAKMEAQRAMDIQRAADAEVEALRRKLEEAEREAVAANQNAIAKRAEAAAMRQPDADEDAAPLLARLNTLEADNAKVRANLSKRAAIEEAADYRAEWESCNAEVQKIRDERIHLLAEVEMPLPELGLAPSNSGKPVLTYEGKRWDSMATSEQLKVATAIAAAANDKCGFVLLDRLEALDKDQLEAFGDWLALRGLQAICTRVSTGEECTIVIEDGMIKED